MNNKGQRIAYRRVSTLIQNTARQLDGMEFDQEFTDKASGKDTKRPQLEAMLKHVRAGDHVFVHSIDRLARNTADLLELVETLTTKGVSLTFVKENLNFTSDRADPFQMLMLSMLGSVATFERAIINERQREGIAIAKSEGKFKGGKAKLSADQAAQLRAKVAEGIPKAKVAREFGISRETLYQYLNQEAA
ncbi:recombinase family protein [Caballeronia novacaledonica]|uniref:Recombinase family protein n=1 Tax=Caballeronia novacaledonica TaxID=1544861 RepID=A0AA37MQY8_9BURK|nr:recombinase family protein [Caballeronia novacaledonica]GJH23697.1 recombinase family protein [Caballeronia novacaledonica]